MTRQEHNREASSHATCKLLKWKVFTQKPKELCWRRLGNIILEENKPPYNDELITLSKNKRFIEWLPENSEVMYCIDVEDLKKLPKEEKLWQQ